MSGGLSRRFSRNEGSILVSTSVGCPVTGRHVELVHVVPAAGAPRVFAYLLLEIGRYNCQDDEELGVISTVLFEKCAVFGAVMGWKYIRDTPGGICDKLQQATRQLTSNVKRGGEQ
jgi:hypothetical protein